MKMSFRVIVDGVASIKKKRGLTITTITHGSSMASWAIVSGRPRLIKKAIKDVTDNSGWHIHDLSFVD